MRAGRANVWHIAFFTYAVLLLAVPVSAALVRALGASGHHAELVGKAVPFYAFLALLLVVAPLRRATMRLLAAPIPSTRRVEVALVAFCSVGLAFAYTLVLAIAIWAIDGPVGVDKRITVAVEKEMARAFSPEGLVISLLLIPIVGPVIEEIIFRGFLHRALESRWGAFVAAIGSSALFGLYHPHFYAAFTTSIVLVCVLRRTGSLWAPIIVHGVTNLALWWPLTGQYVFPHGVVASDPASWRFHALCLAVAVVALPVYAWMSRDRTESAPTVLMEPNGALSK